jgi:hypothetical protein
VYSSWDYECLLSIPMLVPLIWRTRWCGLCRNVEGTNFVVCLYCVSDVRPQGCRVPQKVMEKLWNAVDEQEEGAAWPLFLSIMLRRRSIVDGYFFSFDPYIYVQCYTCELVKRNCTGPKLNAVPRLSLQKAGGSVQGRCALCTPCLEL